MDNEIKKMISSFDYVEFELVNCSFKKVASKGKRKSSGNKEVVQNYNFEVVSIYETMIELSGKIQQAFKPDAIFRSQTEFNIRVYFEEPINPEIVEKEEIKNCITKWVLPVFSENSFITAFITDRMYDRPLIIAPYPLQDIE